MKLKRSALLALALCGGLFITAIVPIGCSSTADRVTYKTVGTVAVSVDTAMHAWGDYVSAQKRAGTPVPLDQERQVLKAFKVYQSALAASVNAGVAYSQAKGDTNATPGLQASLNQAIAAVSAALSDLLGLISSFGVKTI